MMPKKSQTTPTNQTSRTAEMRSKKSYTKEFELETLQLLKSSGKSKSDLERELGLYPGQIHLWERALSRKEENVQQAFPGTGHQSDAEAEVHRLKRELEIVRQERDILKKAIAYGQSPSSRKRKTETEIRFYSEAPGRVRDKDHVPGAECIKKWILCLAQASRATALKERDGKPGISGGNTDHLQEEPEHIRSTTNTCRVEERRHRLQPKSSSKTHA